jgi:orotate phosphoribosyltransferase
VSDRDELLAGIKARAVIYGDFTLSSGRHASSYVDLRRVLLDGRLAPVAGRVLLNATADLAYEAVGGLTLGADPLASAISLTSYLAGLPISAFIVRKEPKAHGTAQWVEGRTLLVKGDTVAIVDDVVTTGGSTLKAIERVRDEGLTPVVSLALVDRNEGGREVIEATGVTFRSLYDRSDFMGK